MMTYEALKLLETTCFTLAGFIAFTYFMLILRVQCRIFQMKHARKVKIVNGEPVAVIAARFMARHKSVKAALMATISLSELTNVSHIDIMAVQAAIYDRYAGDCDD